MNYTMIHGSTNIEFSKKPDIASCCKVEQLRGGAVARGSGAGWQPSSYEVSHGISDVAGCSEHGRKPSGYIQGRGSYD